MSFVGPRPNVSEAVLLYTDVERELLYIKPGITDFGSIVFWDQGDILKGSSNPDLSYHQLIRPIINELALIYRNQSSIWTDLKLIWATAISILNRRIGIRIVVSILSDLGAHEELLSKVLRLYPLEPAPPPGASDIVTKLA